MKIIIHYNLRLSFVRHNSFLLILLLSAVLFTACKKGSVTEPSIPDTIKSDSLGSGWTLINFDTISYSGVDFSGIYFNNSAVGYAVGNGLWKSTNGGINWVPASGGWQGKNLAVTANGNIFIVPYYPWNGLYKSTDGGQHFSSKNINMPGNFGDIFFTGNDTGYVSTDSVLLRTVDAGKNWDAVTTTGLGVSSLYNSLFFFNDNLGWICDSSNVYKTNGNIHSWTKLTIHINNAFEYVCGIFATSPANIYLSVSSGGIYKSTDGGNNFYLRGNVFANQGDHWSELHFVNDNIGYISFEKGIYKTSDGGVTWQADVVLGEKYISEIHFTDANHGWACGKGVILRYAQ